MGFGLTLTFSCPMWWLGTVSQCVSRADWGGYGPKPTPDKPSVRQGGLGEPQLCTPTIIWLCCQHHLHPPISGHEQKEFASAHKPYEHNWIFISYENWVLYKALVQQFSNGDQLMNCSSLISSRGSLQYSAESCPNWCLKIKSFQLRCKIFPPPSSANSPLGT